MTKMRHLSRDSAHRRALLRNLATSLIEHESITTTWPKAKEAQRWVEKLITLGKRNTNAARSRAQGMIFDDHKHMPKIFGELATRYAARPGGYTRVLRTESHNDDAGESAILSLVDGPRDIRFAMTAKAILRQQTEKLPVHEKTVLNMHKVTRYRENGEQELEAEVQRLSLAQKAEEEALVKSHEQDGSHFEWRRGPHRRSGPGSMVKRRIETGEAGADPHALLQRLDKGRKLKSINTL